MSYYIRVPYQGPNDDFYFEFPLEEERLAEQVQLVDILPKEDVDEFYAKTENEEVNDDATNTAEECPSSAEKGLKSPLENSPPEL